MKRCWVLILALPASTLAASGQTIEIQKNQRDRIVRVATALDHLTVIEPGEPVTQVAGGSSAFKVEWRDDKVFVQPLEPDVATNLFIWTESGRLNYELLPAGGVERMHFAIDYERPEIAATVPAAPLTPAVESRTVPNDMLLRSVAVKLAGVRPPKQRVGVVLRDLYRRDDKLYIRYAISNHGRTTYQAGAPEVVALESPRSSRSLRSLANTQLGTKYARRLKSNGETAVSVLHTEVESSVVKPGQETTGLVALELPPETQLRTVLRLAFPADSAGPITAVLVL